MNNSTALSAVFTIHNHNGPDLIIRPTESYAADPEWLAAVQGFLPEEELRHQLETQMMNEFIRVLPVFINQVEARNRILAEANDPQGGNSVDLPTLSRDEYNALDSRRYHKTDKDEQFKQCECVICMEKFKSNNKIPILPCGHDFHWKCLEKWATENHKVCPICKKNLDDK